jgi:drug/metabolite transporter (DMT)-like permease
MNFVAMKVVYRQLTPEALFVLRYFIMGAVFVVACRVSGISLHVEPADRRPVLWFGFIAMGVYLVFFTLGMKDSSAAEGALILALAPLMTAVGEIILGHQAPSLRLLLGGLVAVGGVALVVFGNGHAQVKGHLAGNLLLFVSAILWAYSALLMKPLLVRYRPLQLMTVSYVGALPVVLLFLPWLLRSHLAQLDLPSWLSIAHIALGSGVLGFTLFYAGVKLIGPSRAVTYQYFTPITTALFAWPILGTPITWLQVLGMSVVIGGLVLARREAPQPETGAGPSPAIEVPAGTMEA